MKYKAGDKVKVKEKFWEIESGIYFNGNMKKLLGKTLEVGSVDINGSVFTKQDDSNDSTAWTWDENWIELYRPTITWDTLKWKDVLVEEDGREQIVLGVLNDLVFISWDNDLSEVDDSTYHKQQLQDRGYTIKQPTPAIVEKLELTLDQIAKKFGVDVTNIKIKE